MGSLDIIEINGFCCLEIGDVWDLKIFWDHLGVATDWWDELIEFWYF